MHKTLTVAGREYVAAVKTKAFVVSLVLMPVLMLGSIVVQVLLKDQVDLTARKVAVVDNTGALFETLQTAAERRNRLDIYDGTVGWPEKPDLSLLPDDLQSRLQYDAEDQELRFSGQMTESQRDVVLSSLGGGERDERIQKLFENSRKQVQPKFILEEVDPASGTPEEIRTRLKQSIEDRELFAFVEIAPDLVERKEPKETPAVTYYTARTTFQDIRDWMSGPINQFVYKARVQSADLDPEKVSWATHRFYIPVRHVRSIDESGRRVAGEDTSEIAQILVPMFMMFLMFMVIMVGATPLVQSVLEEKMQKISEVLVASVRPFELMLGKLLGIVGVSLTIVAVYLAGAYAATVYYNYTDFLPPHLYLWFVVYQVLAIVMFGSVFIAIGSACSEMKETQSLLTPAMLLVAFPLFIWFNVIREPHSSFSMVMSFIPTNAPMLMVARLAADPELPVWQPLAGVGLVLLTTLAFVWAAGRIFRVGILMQGKGAKVGEMMRWVVKG